MGTLLMAIASVRYFGNVEITEDYQNLLEIFPRSTRLIESSQGEQRNVAKKGKFDQVGW